MIFKRTVTSCLPKCFYTLYFPLTVIFMFYLNIMQSKIFIIGLNQHNHMSSLFHNYCPISNNCIHIWMNSSGFYDSQQALFVTTNFAWLHTFPSQWLQVNWLTNLWFLALLIGYLHKGHYESDSLTLFQLIAAAAVVVVKSSISVDNCFHDY